MSQNRPPRDPKELAREIDATIRARDVKEWLYLMDAVAPRFGEMILLAGVFFFALGLILTIFFVAPQENDTTYLLWVLWGCGYLFATTFAFEFVIRKFRTLRRMVEIAGRRIERLEKELKRLREEQEKAGEGEEAERE